MLNGYQLWWVKNQVVRTKGEPLLIFMEQASQAVSGFLVLFRYGTRTEKPRLKKKKRSNWGLTRVNWLVSIEPELGMISGNRTGGSYRTAQHWKIQNTPSPAPPP